LKWQVTISQSRLHPDHFVLKPRPTSSLNFDRIPWCCFEYGNLVQRQTHLQTLKHNSSFSGRR